MTSGWWTLCGFLDSFLLSEEAGLFDDEGVAFLERGCMLPGDMMARDFYDVELIMSDLRVYVDGINVRMNALFSERS